MTKFAANLHQLELTGASSCDELFSQQVPHRYCQKRIFSSNTLPINQMHNKQQSCDQFKDKISFYIALHNAVVPIGEVRQVRRKVENFPLELHFII